MNELALRTTQEFHQRFGGTPVLFSQAPGRINIIGEHTDYTGGFSLPAAINCWTLCAWRPRKDDKIRIHAANMNESWDTSWAELESSIDQSWKKYVGGALSLFKNEQLEATPAGLELAILGNVPLGKGVSSSASIELAVLNGLNALYKKKMTPVALAKMAQQVEHQFLKVKSGLLDQFASQFCKKQSALLIDFNSLETQPAPMEKSFDSYLWVLVDSMVKRELASSKYSERVDEYNKILDILKKHGKKSLRDISSGEVASLFASAGDNILKRARHIVSENERTLKAFECLKTGQVTALGVLLYESHESLSADYEVSHPNLDRIVDIGKTLHGVVGGRMMGGGFGGCCLFLVEKAEKDSVCTGFAAEYEAATEIQTIPLSVELVDGASAWTYGN